MPKIFVKFYLKLILKMVATSRNLDHEFAEINSRNIILVVSNLSPFSVSVFFSGKILPTEI